MGKKTFLLINPYIAGKFNKVYEGSSPLSAAKRAYTSLAENFKNSVKEFRFTLLEVDSNIKNDKLNFKNYKNYPSNKYYNFIVNEKLNNNNNKVKFKLARDNVELVNSNLLLKRINSIEKKYGAIKSNKLKGGKPIFDDDDDDEFNDIDDELVDDDQIYYYYYYYPWYISADDKLSWPAIYLPLISGLGTGSLVVDATFLKHITNQVNVIV